MKNLLKNLGAIMIIIGAIILIACFMTQNVNNNVISGMSLLLIILGLIAHIAINKKITD